MLIRENLSTILSEMPVGVVVSGCKLSLTIYLPYIVYLNHKGKTMKYLKWKIAVPPKLSNIPEKAGIYILSTIQEVDQKYEVKYVGQADNLRLRAEEHWSKNESNKRLKDHLAEKYIMKFNYSLIESKEDREGMVLYLLKFFNPPFNTDFNKDSPPEKPVVKCTVPDVRKYL